jgi:glycosyltransferase involved in cell wall biosynthesis
MEKYLEKCLNSIKNQTYKNLQIILVNDGSVDKSELICKNYCLKDNRFSLISQKNAGLSSARNLGLTIAKGEYIGFIDSDDYVESDMYERLLEGCIANKSKISMCGRINIYNNKIKENFVLKKGYLWNNTDAIKRIINWKNIDVSVCDKLFHRSLFKEIRFPVGKYNEDIFVTPKLIHLSGSIFHIGSSKYYYIHRQGSISSQFFNPKKFDLLIAIEDFRSFLLHHYKNLNKHYYYYEFLNLLYLIQILTINQQIKKYKPQYNTIKKKLLKISFKVFTSFKVSFIHKLMLFLILVNFYSSLIKIKNILID